MSKECQNSRISSTGAVYSNSSVSIIRSEPINMRSVTSSIRIQIATISAEYYVIELWGWIYDLDLNLASAVRKSVLYQPIWQRNLYTTWQSQNAHRRIFVYSGKNRFRFAVRKPEFLEGGFYAIQILSICFIRFMTGECDGNCFSNIDWYRTRSLVIFGSLFWMDCCIGC